VMRNSPAARMASDLPTVVQSNVPRMAVGAPQTTSSSSTAELTEQRRDHRWRWALGAVCLLALFVRLVYLFGWQDLDEVGGDAWYYHEAANLLADGEGFIHPYLLEDDGVRAPGADHPPGYST